MNKRNYQKELDQLIELLSDKNEVPTLLLHSCCAPCSSYVLEYLSRYFKITVFYFNPNIFPEEEYVKRVIEQQDLIKKLNPIYPIEFKEGRYSPDEYYQTVKGVEQIKEGGERCFRCFELRLRQSAQIAQDNKFDYFTTTLSISPLKNAEKLNEIGEALARKYEVKYLSSDFKKKDGYKRSIQLSSDYGLYRQDYCGCIFSKHEREV